MPTNTQLIELFSWTNYSWTMIDGVYGGMFISKTDISRFIFLPAAGWMDGGRQIGVGANGCYWTSTPNGAAYAFQFLFESSHCDSRSSARTSAFPVRPVIG
jgi:hypothetical protein